MYRELLALSLGDPPQGSPLERLLDVARAARSRVAGADSTESQVARQLDYDRALVELCRAASIAVDLEGFSRPDEERLRLERALGERGLEVGTG